MPRMEPPTSEVTAPFWEATREQKLVLQWCSACDAVVHYPRPICPACFGTDLEWRPSSGRGEVHTFTVIHKPQMPVLDPPFTVALVELEGGARMMTNIVNCDPDVVAVGMPVQVTWEPLSDGRNLPQFEPAVGG